VPIKWRLTLFNALVIGGILLVLGISVFFLVRGVLLSGVEDTVRSRATSVARTVGAGQPLSPNDVEQLTLEGVFVVVRDGEGRVLAHSVDADPRQDTDAPFWRRVLETGKPEGGKVDVSRDDRGYVYAVPVTPLSRPEVLPAPSPLPNAGQVRPTNPLSAARVVEVGKSYESAAAAVRTFGTVLAAGVLAAFLVSVGGAYLLARAALSPVEAVVGAARGITEGDLSKRLPVSRPKDEIGRLATTINDLLARLEEAFARREEALARQRRFVADASHELRTPLTSIDGYAKMLDQWALQDPEVAKESVEAIRRDSQRMKGLVEGMLSLARGDEGAPMEPREHDLGSVAAEAVSAARAVACGRVSVRYVPSADPVRATFDYALIRQVAGILLDNALKYTPEGGRVTVSVREREGRVQFEVSDTGVGIPEEHMPFIFERFYRVDEARSTAGAGLGLSIAHQIVEAHGGSISAESEPGRGSTFALQIPKNGYVRAQHSGHQQHDSSAPG
jgi:signal transduction histidine kinase